MTEPASVVAARQLAAEARDRPAPPARRIRARRIRAAVLAAGALGTAGCTGGDRVCSTIGYGSALTVELVDWPSGGDRLVGVDCTPACLPPFMGLQEETAGPLPGMPAAPVPTAGVATTPAAEPLIAVDAAGRAVLQLFGQQPDEVVVRVLEDDAVLAELTVRPEFVRIDGTAECGGNTEARIVVPPP